MRWPWTRPPEVVHTEYEPPAKGIKGATVRLQSDKKRFRSARDILDQRQELATHAEYSRLYGGSVAGSVLDTEVDDIFAQGWGLLSDDPDAVTRVRDYLITAGWEREVRKMCTESKVFGFGIAEVGTVGPRHVLVAHSSLNIIPKMDAEGWLDGFAQYTDNRITTEWTAREVISLALRPNAATPGIGLSELMHPYASIIDYENIRQANAEMIMRAGYPMYNVEFDGDAAPGAQFLEGNVADIGPGSVIETALGTKLNALNVQGITQVQAYAEMALQAVSQAMQVPRSMVGLSDNSEATAKVNLTKYYNRVQAEQGIIAQTMQSRYLDIYVLPDLGLKAGDVQLYFNNPDPEAQLKRVALIRELASIDPADPEFLVSAEEMAEIYGKHPRKGEYDGVDTQTIMREAAERHLREALGVPKEPEA